MSITVTVTVKNIRIKLGKKVLIVTYISGSKTTSIVSDNPSRRERIRVYMSWS